MPLSVNIFQGLTSKKDPDKIIILFTVLGDMYKIHIIILFFNILFFYLNTKFHCHIATSFL